MGLFALVPRTLMHRTVFLHSRIVTAGGVKGTKMVYSTTHPCQMW
jgi:hypothetical protein